MVKRHGKRKSIHRGGEGGNGRPMSGGDLPSLMPSVYNAEGAPLAKSNYYTINGGSRRRRHTRRRHRSVKKGGSGVLAAAAVPFGLLALQRYFMGKSTHKRHGRRSRKFRGGSLGGKLQGFSPASF